MKRLFLLMLLPFLSLIPRFLQAQTPPVLTAANTNPVLGETFKIWVERGTQLTNISGGPNQVWNTGPLPRAWHHTFTFRDTVGMPPSWYAIYYPNANLHRQQELAYWEFIETTPNSLLNRGVVNTRGIIAKITTYSDPALVLNYPFTYNNSVADTFRGTAGMGSPQYNIFGKITSFGHGYGTIQTPAGTFNVLCVKTIEWETDSIGNSVSWLGDSTATYSFYSPGIHYPVFKSVYRRDVAGVYYWVEYLDVTSILSATAEINNPFGLKMFPNPATSETTIQYELKTASTVRLVLTDVLGKETEISKQTTKAAGSYSENLQVSHLPKSIYFLRLETEGNVAVKRLIVQ